jgi:hypothetical protein
MTDTMYNKMFRRKTVLFLLLAILFDVVYAGAGVAGPARKAKQVGDDAGYTISGHVSHEFSPDPFPGVVIVANNGVTATTDHSGAFQLQGLPAGIYIITPTTTLMGEMIIASPSSRTVNLPPDSINQNFTAAIVVSDAGVGGQVTLADGRPVSDVILHLSDVDTTVTDEDGRYFFFPVAPGEYTLWPDKAGYVFQPGQRTVRLPIDNSSQDFVAGSEYVITLPLVLR